MAEVVEPAKVEVIANIDDHGLLVFKDHKELGVAASIAIQTGIAPDHLKKEGREAVAAALMFCKQFNLPQKAMNQMAFVKGKIVCFGSLVTALAERHPLYGERRTFFIDAEFTEICVKNKNLKAEVWAAVVQIKKKGSTVWNEYFFSIEDAGKANLLTNQTKVDSGWVKYLKDMLYHKANKRGLQDNYASAIEGVEYYEDLKEIIDVTPSSGDIKSNANAMNEMLLGEGDV